MSPYSSDFGWFTPGAWGYSHEAILGASQTDPNSLNHSSQFSMHQEGGFQSADPLLFGYAPQPSPALLNPGYTVPSAGPQADLGSLDWPTNEMPLGYTSSGDNGTPSLQTRSLDPHTSTEFPPTRSNIGPSIQEHQTLMAETNDNSHKKTARPSRASRTSDIAHPATAIKCEWKGCIYTGIFSRRADLKRHVETQHISPNLYGCPRCNKSFNRRDNLEQHLYRVHSWNSSQLFQLFHGVRSKREFGSHARLFA